VGNPTGVAIGDFNEAGINDLVATNSSSNNISVLLGNGGATYRRARNIPTGLRPAWVAVGDFNNDGHLDLAVVNGGSDDVSVLRGRGDGTFLPLGAVLTPSAPTAVVLGDYNRDGNLDLAVLRDIGVAVALGNGDGTFQAPSNFSTGLSSMNSVAKGDFNGDRIDDLVVTSGSFFTTQNVAVLLGNGTGGFQSPRLLTANRSATSVAVGDLNGDGFADIAVANNASNNVTVFLGNGDGTFQPGVDFFVVGLSPTSVAIGDFNGDGRMDMAVSNSQSSNVSILLNFEVPRCRYSRRSRSATLASFRPVRLRGFSSLGKLSGMDVPDLAVADNASNDVTLLINTTR